MIYDRMPNKVKINSNMRRVCMMKTFIIAEAGVNHNGSLVMAKQLVDVAKQAGADAVKFQTFKAENLVTKSAQQATYQIENLGESSSQYEMLKKLELSYEEFVELKRYCKEVNVHFLSTPFDLESVDFLIEELQIDTVKIPSGELTNSPFIYEIAKKRKPMIISTGMATVEEIHEVLSVAAFGLAQKKVTELKKTKAFYTTVEAKELLKEYVTILHCTTEYPAPYDTINLMAMVHLKEVLDMKIGLSDHSQGVAIPIAAVALGAQVIEKHFTLDKNLDGPDHKASLNPKELASMVLQIRQIEKALGNGVKHPSLQELENRIPVRKSLVARRNIVAGELFTENNLTVKRPGNGMSPSNYWELLGKMAKKSYFEDEMINE